MSDGNGWSDFATAALNSLGRSAPWVVIGCLTAFAVYKLQEQSQASFSELREISDSERRAAREDFVQANETLQTSFKGVQNLTDQMLKSFQDQLRQMQEMETSVRQKQQEAFESSLEAQKTLVEIEKQRSALEKSRAELDAVRSQIELSREEAKDLARERDEAQLARAAAQDEVESLRQSLATEQLTLQTARDNLVATKLASDRLNENLSDRRAELDQALARLEEVLGVLNRLATISDDVTQSELAALRDRAQEILPGVTTFLSAYLSQTAANRDKVSTSSVVGVTLAELKSAMAETEDIYWYIARSYSDNISIFGIPASEGPNSVVENVLSISIQLADIDIVDAVRYFESHDLETFKSAQIQGISFVSSVAFSCISPGNTVSVGACRSANNNGLIWTGAGAYRFSDLLGLSEGVPLFSAPNPNVMLLDHKEAIGHILRLKLLNLAPKEPIKRDEGRLFSYALAVRGADEVGIRLSSTDISSEVHDALETWLTSHYQKIASSTNNYSTPIVLSGVKGSDAREIGAFFSEVLARVLDQRLATGVFPQSYELIGVQGKNGIRVEATGIGNPRGFRELPNHLILSVDGNGQEFSVAQSTMPAR